MLVEPTHYNLTFGDGPLKDGHVTVASMSVRETWAYNDKLAELTDLDARYRFMVQTVAPLIVGWDLEKTAGEPWPLTLEGVMELPDSYLPEIVHGWLQAINGAPDPTSASDEPEEDEDEDPLASLPIETLNG